VDCLRALRIVIVCALLAGRAAASPDPPPDVPPPDVVQPAPPEVAQPAPPETAQPAPPETAQPAPAIAPPPNPAAGERADGRSWERPAGEKALIIPRLLLAPPWLLMRVLAYPARWLTEMEARYHLYRRGIETFTSKDGLVGLRPVFQWVSGFNPVGGVSFFDERLLGRETSFHAAVTYGIPDLVFASVQMRPTHADSPVQVLIDTTYDRRSDRRFVGIGTAAPLRPGQLPAARFRADMFDVRTDFRFALGRYFGFGVGGGFGLRRYGNGRAVDGDPPIEDVYCVRTPAGACVPNTVDPFLVPGFNNGTTYIRPNAELRFDSRDHPFKTSSGLVIAVDGDYSYGVTSTDPSNYFRVHGIGQLAINLWQRSRILVLSVESALAATVHEDGVVPFTELPMLGGPDTLRGFAVGRFRGFSSFMASAEYRWPIWMWADGTLFVDYGGVFGRYYAGFGAPQMQPDVGIGLRVRTSQRFYFRFQVAYGIGEGFRVYLSGSNRP
jgi:hypothetical protein